ncbi:hypothetical protein NQZ68_012067 [Dissostichus eleginoides]|nr:hypothetical protein NQZ68_012067 [Dissostichus eleginoides]
MKCSCHSAEVQKDQLLLCHLGHLGPSPMEWPMIIVYFQLCVEKKHRPRLVLSTAILLKYVFNARADVKQLLERHSSERPSRGDDTQLTPQLLPTNNSCH